MGDEIAYLNQTVESKTGNASGCRDGIKASLGRVLDRAPGLMANTLSDKEKRRLAQGLHGVACGTMPFVLFAPYFLQGVEL